MEMIEEGGEEEHAFDETEDSNPPGEDGENPEGEGEPAAEGLSLCLSGWLYVLKPERMFQ